MDMYSGDGQAFLHYRESSKSFTLIFKTNNELLYSTIISKDTITAFGESLYQASHDNFTELDNKTLAQKYIEYIDIIA